MQPTLVQKIQLSNILMYRRSKMNSFRCVTKVHPDSRLKTAQRTIFQYI